MDDMDRAVRFSTDVLVLEAGKRTEEWCEVEAGNLTIGPNARGARPRTPTAAR